MGVSYTFLMIMMAIENYKTRVNDLIILSMTCFRIKGHFMFFSLKVVIFYMGFNWLLMGSSKYQ